LITALYKVFIFIENNPSLLLQSLSYYATLSPMNSKTNKGETAMKNSIYEGMPNLGYSSNNRDFTNARKFPYIAKCRKSSKPLTANYKQSKMPRSIKN